MLGINTVSKDIMEALDQEMVSPDTGDYSPNASQVAQTLKALSAQLRFSLVSLADDLDDIPELLEDIADRVLLDAEESGGLNISVTMNRDIWNGTALSESF